MERVRNSWTRINDVALELNCVREEYFGKTFEGNETNKLLKNTDKLREVTDESLHIFIECMEGLLKVKQSCFGFTLEESYKKEIFRDSWIQLNIEFGIPVSNKCHGWGMPPKVRQDLAVVLCEECGKWNPWWKFWSMYQWFQQYEYVKY